MIDSKTIVRIFYKMLKTRLFEEKLVMLKEDGLISDRLCLSLGQEATAAAVCVLDKEDIIFASHRANAVAIGADSDIQPLLAEYMGMKEGLCAGRSSGSSIADNNVNIYGTSALYAGNFITAVGAALSMKIQNKDNCVICFAGDGAASLGNFYEAVNMAALYKLPVIFFIENNCYAKNIRVDKVHNVADIATRAQAFDIPGIITDGNNAIDVYTAVKKALEYAKENASPVIVESKTYRIAGHTYNEEQYYRNQQEVMDWTGYDPIENLTAYMREHALGNMDDLMMMREKIQQEVDVAAKALTDELKPAENIDFTPEKEADEQK